MSVTPTDIQGLFVVDSPLIEDARGFFRETYQLGAIREALGRDVTFRQGNHSRSAPGVLRGFHAEPWDKLVYVVRGTALCVVADVRPESQTFGFARSFLLGDAPGIRSRLLIVEGLANAVQAVTEVDYVNEVSEHFSPTDRRGFAWNDPTLDVAWQVADPILSAADAGLPTLSAVFGPRPASTVRDPRATAVGA